VSASDLPPTFPGGAGAPLLRSKATPTTLSSSMCFFFFLIESPRAMLLKIPFFFFLVEVVFIDASVMVVE